MLINRKLQKKLKNHEFTILCSNCNGGKIYHDLHVKFDTPTINLYMLPEDFVKFCENISYYVTLELSEFKSELEFPVGRLGDIKIYFNHAGTFTEAKEEWDRRKERIHFENIFLMMTEFRGCTYELLKRFDKLPYPKVVFTAFPYREIGSAVFLSDYFRQKYVGYIGYLDNLKFQRKYEERFDIISWLNKEDEYH